MKPTYVVGGEGSFVRRTIAPRLEAWGLKMNGHWEMHRSGTPVFPADTEVIVCLTDMMGHTQGEMAEREGRRRGIFTVRTQRKKAVFEEQMARLGYVKLKDVPEPTETFTAGDDRHFRSKWLIPAMDILRENPGMSNEDLSEVVGVREYGVFALARKLLAADGTPIPTAAARMEHARASLPRTTTTVLSVEEPAKVKEPEPPPSLKPAWMPGPLWAAINAVRALMGSAKVTSLTIEKDTISYKRKVEKIVVVEEDESDIILADPPDDDS